MPFVRVHLAAGRPAAQKKAILDGVHAALVDAFRIPEQDRNQLVHEYPPDGFEARHGPEAVCGKAASDVHLPFKLDG